MINGEQSMKKAISAVFESPDAAELALMAMQRDNIPILHQDTHKVDDVKHERDIFYMAPIYSAHRSDPNNQSIAPLPIIRQNINPTHEHLFNDVVSRDVCLEVEVPSNFAKRTRSKLVSYHGHSISEQSAF